MANKIRIKRTDVSGRTGADAALVAGELAMNTTDNKLWGQGDSTFEVLTDQSTAVQLGYDSSANEMTATNVQSAIDELQATKASVDLLSASITLYPTTASGDFGYNRLVTSTDDVDYDAVAVDVPTGTIDVDEKLVGALIADAGLFVGNPGVITIPTIGNVAKIGGNSNQYAGFYFTVSHRDASGTETVVATSSSTGAINPEDSAYYQFSASALLNNGTWVGTDRLVIKYYAELLGNTGSSYNFQFGGSNPVRTNLPVPVSVIPSDIAEDIIVDTSTFSGILSGADDTVQKALNTIDDHTHGLVTDGDGNQFLANDGSYKSFTASGEADGLSATGITAGYVLTADGDDTISWQDIDAYLGTVYEGL